MSTFEPVPRPEDYEDSTTPEVAPEPAVNEPNKAVVTAVGLVAALIAQWVISQGFDLDQEGITAILVPLLTGIVYRVSNQTSLF